MKTILAALAVITLFMGGALSLFVSSRPDGLEWSIEKITGKAGLESKEPFAASLMESAAAIQEKTAFMPDYDFKESGERGIGTAAAGIAGGVFTFFLAGISVFTISFIKRKQKNKAAAAV
jgi:cobalt/nickel transport system permease protein